MPIHHNAEHTTCFSLHLIPLSTPTSLPHLLFSQLQHFESADLPVAGVFSSRSLSLASRYTVVVVAAMSLSHGCRLPACPTSRSSVPLLLVILTLSAQLAVLLPVHGQTAPSYTLLPLPVSAPYSVAVDAAGAQLYVSIATTGNTLLHYTTQSNGSWVVNRSLSPTYFPYGLALSSATSSLFIADFGYSTVSRADATTGALLSNVYLNGAYGVALDSSGSLFVSASNIMTRYSVVSGQLIPNTTRTLPTLPTNGVTGGLTGVAVDGSGLVYVCDPVYNRVLKLSHDLSAILANITVPSSPLNGPQAVAVHPVSGDVYIADYGNNRVVHLLANMTFAGNITVPAAAGTFHPWAVALDLAGRLYVADFGNARVVIFNLNFTASTAWSSSSSAAQLLSPSSSSSSSSSLPPASPAGAVVRPGTLLAVYPNSSSLVASGYAFDYLYGAAVDAAGTIYLADSYTADNGGHGRVVVLSPAGALLRAFPNTSSPVASSYAFNDLQGLTLDAAGNIYAPDVSTSTNNGIGRLVVLSPTGELLRAFPNASNPLARSYQFSDVSPVALDGSGNIWLGDYSTPANGGVGRVVVLSSAGQLLHVYPNASNPAANSYAFSYVGTVALDGMGSVYVADQGSSANGGTGRVVVLSSTTGALLRTLPDANDSCARAYQFSTVVGVAVDAMGRVYVADYQSSDNGGSGRVLVLSSSGQLLYAFPNASDPASSQYAFQLLGGVALDSTGNVYVSDYSSAANGGVGRLLVLQGLANATGTAASASACSSAASSYSSSASSASPPSLSSVSASPPSSSPRSSSPSSALLSSAAAASSSSSSSSSSAAVLALPSYTVLPLPPSTYAFSIAVDAAGSQLYLGGLGYVLHYSALSNGSWVLNRSLSATVGSPAGLALSSATSSMFIADYAYNTVSRLDATTGALLSNVTLSYAYGAALDSSGNLFVSGRYTNSITRYSVVSGQLVLNTTRTLPTNGLAGVAVDGSGCVYVCGYNDNRVLKLSHDLSTILANITVPSSPLSYPYGVAVHPVTGDVYITDPGNYRVVHLLPDLSYAGNLTLPAVAGTFFPYAVALDLAGRLYATDLYNARVVIFESTLGMSTASAATASSSVPPSSPAASSPLSSSSSTSRSPLSTSSTASFFSSSSSSSASSSALPLQPSLVLSAISATSLSVGLPTAVQLYGQHVDKAAFALVAAANLSAELSAGVDGPDLASLPQVNHTDLNATSAILQLWAAANGYLVVDLVQLNASSSSTDGRDGGQQQPLPVNATSSLLLTVPALFATGYHRLLVLSSDGAAPLQLTDWLFVVQGQCSTLLTVSGVCVDVCPSGCFCTGDGRCWPQPGWWSPSEHIAPTSCVLPSSCPGALEAAASASSPDPILRADGSRATDRCAVSYQGVLCGDCAADYYHAGASCRYCGATDEAQRRSFAGLLIGACLIVALIAGVVCLSSSYLLGDRVSSLFTAQQVVLVGITATQLLPTPQYDWLTQVFTDVSIVNLDVAMFHPGCAIAALSYVQVFWVTLAFVCGAVGVFSLAAYVRACLVVQHVRGDPVQGYWRWWRRTGEALSVTLPEPAVDDQTEEGVQGSSSSSSSSSSHNSSREHSSSSHSSYVDEQRRQQLQLAERVAVVRYLQSWPLHLRPDLSAGFRMGRCRVLVWRCVFRARLLQALLACGVLVYLRVTTVVLQMVSCTVVQNLQGTGTIAVLRVDRRTRCYEGSHVPAVVVAWMLLFGFSIAFPVLLYMALRRVHRKAYLRRKMQELLMPGTPRSPSQSHTHTPAGAMSPGAVSAITAGEDASSSRSALPTSPMSMMTSSQLSMLSSHGGGSESNGANATPRHAGDGDDEKAIASQRIGHPQLRVDTGETSGEGDTAAGGVVVSERPAAHTADWEEGQEEDMEEEEKEDETADFVDSLASAMSPRYLLTAVKHSQLSVQDAQRLQLEQEQQQRQHHHHHHQQQHHHVQPHLSSSLHVVVHGRFSRYGYLLSSLRDERHHFALSDVVVAFFLALAVVLPAALYLQVFASAFTFFAYGVLVAAVWPFTGSKDNVHAIVGAVGLLLQCLVGLSLIQALSTSSLSAAYNAAPSVPLQQRLAQLTVELLEHNVAYIATLTGLLLALASLGIVGLLCRRSRHSQQQRKLRRVLTPSTTTASAHAVGAAAAAGTATAATAPSAHARQASEVEMGEMGYKSAVADTEQRALPSAVQLTAASSDGLPLMQPQAMAARPPPIPARPAPCPAILDVEGEPRPARAAGDAQAEHWKTQARDSATQHSQPAVLEDPYAQAAAAALAEQAGRHADAVLRA